MSKQYIPKKLYKDSNYVCSFEQQHADAMNGLSRTVDPELTPRVSSSSGTLTLANLEKMYKQVEKLADQCDFCKRKADHLYIGRNGNRGFLGQVCKIHAKKMKHA